VEERVEIGIGRNERRTKKEGKKEISLLGVKLAVLSVMFINVVGFRVCVGVRDLDQTIHVL
jgi:hypothetical protein